VPTLPSGTLSVRVFTWGVKDVSQPTGILPWLAERALLPADTLAVFCGGAQARGWNDPVAAVRVRVVGAAPAAPEGAETERVSATADVPALTVRIADREVRLTWWTREQTDAVLERVSWARLEQATVAPLLGMAEELLVEDLLTGSALLGEELVAELRRTAEASAFRSFVRTRSLGDAEGAVEDAVGQLRSGDLHSAVLSARKAFGHLVDNMLEARGCYGTYAPEMRARRFAEAAPAQLGFAQYWAVETMADLDPDRPEAWVEQVLAFCQKELADQPAELFRRAMRGPRRGW
jgi:hypothetical protein